MTDRPLKLLVMVLLLTTGGAMAQKRDITYDDIAQGHLAARSIRGLQSMADGQHYSMQKRDAIVRYRYNDGQALDTLFNAEWYKGEIGSVADYAFSKDEMIMLLKTNPRPIYRHSSQSDFWIYDRTAKTLKPVSTAGAQQEAMLSPDGRKVAYVRGNNLWVLDIFSGIEKQITVDGVQGEIINGIPDWVYEEEFGFSRAFEWSPSSDAIAFYRFDERRVKSYAMQTFKSKIYPEDYTFKYPKAGQENSLIQIKVFRIQTGGMTTLDIGTELDIYIPRIEWTGRGNEIAIHRLNRNQNQYNLLLADAVLGNSKVIYNEVSSTYVERIDDQKITILPDGRRFIVKNETDGWMHLYMYDLTTGKYISQITKGEWEVTKINGIDMRSGKIFYTSTEGSPLERAFFSINFDGSGKRPLTSEAGYYKISMSRGAKYFISQYSTATTPNIATLHQANGKIVRTLELNDMLKTHLQEYDMPRKEFIKFTTERGDELMGYIIKPSDFDSTKSYPLFMTQYSGPGSQRVTNSWEHSWEEALVAEGYLVACVDGRGTGFRGAAFKQCTYKNLGQKEVEDQISAARFFATLPYIDADRIGIYGWSYGGFMSLGCILKGADIFKMAIAVAPVTSWRYYDTIYTELYNGLPDENPDGYDKNSPINFAELLQGKLLIAHGTADDNVHVQNSYDMISALLSKDKHFDWVIYPDVNHSMGVFRKDLTLKMIDYTKKNL
ncbi:MAG: S9 family peptidase [Mucinivorans sp.]